MKLSIIIPVYNVEKYISQCLDSVLEQDIPYLEYEVIVVNDGSPDNSAAIIAEYEKKYPNIVYIFKENGGLSSARNAGLKVAKGDYLWFIDSDDWIEKNCLKNLLEYTYKNDLDFCEFPHTIVFKNNSFVYTKNNRLNEQIVSNVDYISQYAMPYSAWSNIVKREIITNNKLSYVDGILHEDVEFNIRLLSHCNRISYHDNFNNALYFYRRDREESIINNISNTKKRVDSYLKILKFTEDNFPYNKNVKDYAFCIQYVVNEIIASALVDVIRFSSIKNKAHFYREVISENNINYRLDVLSGKDKIKFSVLSIVRKNLWLTIFTLKMFSAIGSFLIRIKK